MNGWSSGHQLRGRVGVWTIDFQARLRQVVRRLLARPGPGNHAIIPAMTMGQLFDLASYLAMGMMAAAVLGLVLAWLEVRARSPDDDELPDDPEELFGKRVSDIRSLLRQSRVERRLWGLVVIGLDVAQYTVGASLAGSTAADLAGSEGWRMNSSTTGIYGAIIIVAGIVHRRFKPDRQLTSARKRIPILEGLWRQMEEFKAGLAKVAADKKEARLFEQSRRLSKKLQEIATADVITSEGDEPEKPAKS